MSAPRTYKAYRLPPIRLSGELLETIRQHAEEQGETMSEFIRRAIRQTIERDHLTRRLLAAREAFKDQVFVETDPNDEEGD